MHSKDPSLIRWLHTNEFELSRLAEADPTKAFDCTEYMLEDVKNILAEYVERETKVEYRGTYSDAEIHELLEDFDNSEYALCEVQVHRIPLSQYMTFGQSFDYVKSLIPGGSVEEGQEEQDDEDWDEYYRLYQKYEGMDPRKKASTEDSPLWQQISLTFPDAEIRVNTAGNKYRNWSRQGTTLTAIQVKEEGGFRVEVAVYIVGTHNPLRLVITSIDQFVSLWRLLGFYEKV